MLAIFVMTPAVTLRAGDSGGDVEARHTRQWGAPRPHCRHSQLWVTTGRSAYRGAEQGQGGIRGEADCRVRPAPEAVSCIKSAAQRRVLGSTLGTKAYLALRRRWIEWRRVAPGRRARWSHHPVRRDPAQRLASLLTSMKDDEGRVLVPHYYDGVKLTERERSMLRAVPDEEAAILKRLGIAKPEKVGENLQEAVQYPSLNIRGMQSAAIGEKAANIIPATATAELDLRTTPGANAAYLVAAIEKHIRAQGYHLVTGQPSDDERAKYPKIASLTLRRGSNAAFSEMETPAGAWVQDASAETFASNGQPAKTVRIRLMGGSVPTDKLVEALGIPFVIVPLVNPDNNQHSYDENLRLGHYLDGMRAFVGLLRRPYPAATK